MNQSEIIESEIQTELSKEDYRHYIHIKGARSNNLKNIELYLPKNQLIVVTGLSGSGKSSLIMDTLYAEGQRRYVESLSSYARQFLDRMKKPEVDFIKGICPAIAIEQKVSSSNVRSTVGSLTEIYDYLRLLYARIGKTFSPVTGQEVKKHEVQDVVDFIFSLQESSKVYLYVPLLNSTQRTLAQELDLLQQKGYSRISVDDQIYDINDVLSGNIIDVNKSLSKYHLRVRLLIDRFIVESNDENRSRVADSVSTAMHESGGDCIVHAVNGCDYIFNGRFEADGMVFFEPTQNLFNYNNPYGACPKCEGYGRMIGIDPEKVFPDDSLSVYSEAIACWKGEKGKEWYKRLVAGARHFDFPIHTPVKDLTKEQMQLLWEGNRYFDGLNAFFQELEEGSYKIQNRVLLSRYRGKTVCNVCNGGRLRKEATYVKIYGKDITQLINIPVTELLKFFNEIQLNDHEKKISSRIFTEIINRLYTLNAIGLGYLTLDRPANTLSGGETQRINLTRTLGSNLTNSLYILDEPSVGLHPRDTDKLVRVLKQLRDLKNTVVVVEHEEEVIRNADYLVDIGPLAGQHGGEVVYAGSYNDFLQTPQESLTYDYLKAIKKIYDNATPRKSFGRIQIEGARHNNLKNIDVTIPLQSLTVISGVSGSGKTSLIKHILYPALKKLLGEPLAVLPGKYHLLKGDIKNIDMVEFVSQSPIGKSSRSNPVTYVKAYDSIRKLFSDQQLSKIRGYEPKHFSFNVEGGRCETCKGDGFLTVEMQFLADVTLVCDECNGKRFRKEILDVTYKEKNIYDILDLTIEESLDFFKDKKDIVNKLQPLNDVGLGYIRLGQASSTLSGGEAQRVKLASFMTKEYSSKKIFFIFDEPTTGLHFHDIKKLMDAFNALVESGHSVVVVEHNLDVIRSADWVIDLGPEGGDEGGYLVYQGTPDKLATIDKSYTGQYLAKLNVSRET